MKNTALFMAIPATLLAAFALFNSAGKEKSSCSRQTAVCYQLNHECSMAPDTLRKDPICGMMADDTKKDTVHYKNKVYAFCSKHCKQEFVKDPEAYTPKKKN